MNDPLATVKGQFLETFGAGGRVHVVRTPGRVNLIGEHTDYNDGFVCPMAIEPQVLVVCRGHDDGVVRFASSAFPGEVAQFNVQETIKPGEPTWANYPRGVAAELIEAGIPLPGMDAMIVNSLPVGGGLSSSAAIEVGTARAFLMLAGFEMDAQRLALICQRAETKYAGVPVGIMDMTAVALGRAGHAMLLDCRDLTKTFVPLDQIELRVVIANTMVHHELTDGGYATRRKQCEEGVTYFRSRRSEVKALRDVSSEEVEGAKSKLSDVVYRRCRHVVSENGRATLFASLLSKRRYEEAGELMRASHKSLREDYEVSCAELDFLVEQANAVKGVYGARMTGAGFGGCIVALVQPRSVEALSEQLRNKYIDKFGLKPEIYSTAAAQGATVLE